MALMDPTPIIPKSIPIIIDIKILKMRYIHIFSISESNIHNELIRYIQTMNQFLLNQDQVDVKAPSQIHAKMDRKQ